MTGVLLFAAALLSWTVEAVEVTTVVLAAGVTRSWSSAWRGVLAGTIVLAGVVAALGPAISSIPLGSLRLVVGGLLLVFGLGWLRKAILRASGHKSLHDEASLYERHVAEARTARRDAGHRGATGDDAYAFTLSFKAVVLEGLEVVFIVVTFGANAGQIPLAALAAVTAIAAVAAVALAVRAPLARVPENTIKFAVGVLLSSFGTFWGAEGAGAHWPGSDASLLWLIPAIAVLALAVARALRSVRLAPVPTGTAPGTGTIPVTGPAPAPPAGALAPARRAVHGFGLFWWDFIVGDDWSIAAAVVIGLGAVAALGRGGIVAWWALPVVWAAALLASLARAVGISKARALVA